MYWPLRKGMETDVAITTTKKKCLKKVAELCLVKATSEGREVAEKIEESPETEREREGESEREGEM